MSRFLKRLSILVVLGLAVAIPKAFSQNSIFEPVVNHAITADVLWLIDGDYMLEYAGTISSRTAWTVRVGYTAHRQGQGGRGSEYSRDRHRWYLGFRWRGYYFKPAPNLLFVSFGLDNRPQDNLLAPVAEVGATLNIKPFTASALYSVGYEIYLRKHTAEGLHSRFVNGPEVRVGICF